MTIDIYTTPLLTAREAGRHLRMPESTLDNWLAASKSGEPLVHAVTPERRGWPRVPFVGLIEAYVLRALRDLGMPLVDIKKAADIVRGELDDPYALASKRIATDGVAVFVRLADESVVHARDNQGAIREVLDSYLRYIEWSEDGSPKRLRLSQYPSGAHVVIDPRFGWGAPVLDRNKVKVDDIVALWRAGESIKHVADEYDLAESAVEDVLRQAA
jgi:uncharacterized protein (DUF433 family)